MSNLAFSAVEVETGVHAFLKMPAVRVKITGEISAKDVAPVRKALENVNRGDLNKGDQTTYATVLLDSSGGDVASALEIGRMVRTARAHTEVRGKCVSACIFILAAGVFKNANTDTVGIHRPTFAALDKNLAYAEVRKRLKKLDEGMLAFLVEMDIPSSLLDAMKAIPPERVQWLKQSDLERYRLVGQDAASQELFEAGMAAHYKISKQEFQKRYAATNKLCRISEPGYGECYKRIMEAGVSSPEAREWVEVVNELEITLYAELATIRKSGGKAKMWSLFDAKTPQRRPDGTQWLSMERQDEYDCTQPQSRMLSVTLHSKAMAKGDLIYGNFDAGNWEQIPPDTRPRLLGAVACGKK